MDSGEECVVMILKKETLTLFADSWDIVMHINITISKCEYQGLTVVSLHQGGPRKQISSYNAHCQQIVICHFVYCISS